jgi:hypothetical protein
MLATVHHAASAAQHPRNWWHFHGDTPMIHTVKIGMKTLLIAFCFFCQILLAKYTNFLNTRQQPIYNKNME